MTYVLINNNLVISIEDLDEETIELVRGHYQQILPIEQFSPEPKVGWAWDGTTLYNNLPDITPRQIRTALVLSGISLTMIDEALGSLPEPTKSFAIISWEYAVSFSRRDPLVSNVGLMLGWGDAELDGLWQMAAQI